MTLHTREPKNDDDGLRTAMAWRQKTGRDKLDFSFVAVNRPRRCSGSLEGRVPPFSEVAVAFDGGSDFVRTLRAWYSTWKERKGRSVSVVVAGLSNMAIL